MAGRFFIAELPGKSKNSFAHKDKSNNKDSLLSIMKILLFSQSCPPYLAPGGVQNMRAIWINSDTRDLVGWGQSRPQRRSSRFLEV